MIIGYARVSKDDQNLSLQLDALKQAGCEKIFEDRISGATENRPGLASALLTVRSGDTLVVWRLDRLARSIRHLIDLIERFNKEGIQFKSVRESLDTTTATGELLFHVMAALAQFERSLIRERTMAGLEAARRRGQRIGGKPKLSDKKKAALLKLATDPDGPSVSTICDTFGVSPRTYYRIVNKAEEQRERVA
jgi:DNA invertase Pin-like site-specific DNA recombinase